ETADVVLFKSNPKDVVDLMDLSKKTYRKMVQNLWWSTGYNIFAIPLAAGILSPIGIILSPAVGAVLMRLSTIIVAINAKLLNAYTIIVNNSYSIPCGMLNSLLFMKITIGLEKKLYKRLYMG